MEKLIADLKVAVNNGAFDVDAAFDTREPRDNWEYIKEFCDKFGMPKDMDELDTLVSYVVNKKQKEKQTVEWEWPNLSNCIRNCKKCHGKCFYRKEPYEEQKPASTVESKFKSGDRIRFNGFGSNEYTIQLVGNGYYVNSEGGRMDMSYTDANFVLVENAQKEQRPAELSEDERIREELWEYFHDLQLSSDCEFSPSLTIDEVLAYLERQKVKKIQYELDAPLGQDINGRPIHFEDFQNSVEWGEDERIVLDSIIDDYEKAAKSFCGYDGKIMLLKAIRDGKYDLSKQKWSEEDIKKIRSEEYTKGFNDAAFGGNLKEWSEEDDRKRKGLIKGLEDRMGFGWASDPFSREEYIDWLKLLPERFNLQPKQEWSEEDKKFINDLCNLLAAIAKNNYVGCYYAPDLISKIKSLRPHPHTVSIKDATKFGNLEYERGVKDGIQSEKSRQWKPSEEQVKAIDLAIRFVTDDFSEHPTLSETLRGLYNDLKKL